MDLKEYIASVNQKFCAGNATEHTYRGVLEQLMQSLLPKLRIVNEPKREKCGAPDYIASRKDGLPVFYIEAKDIGDADLDGRNKNGHKEQFDRYKQALDYIIFTDYLDFHLYENGEFVDSVKIAETKGGKIVAIAEAEEKFIGMIQHLGTSAIQRITSASRLAQLMAGKARLLENIIEQAMNEDTDSYANSNLHGQYEAFKMVLIHDLEKSAFADIYAQTIVYGMFAARLHDDTPEDFSREEAARLIPKTNPFLRQIFNTLAGNDLDERIAWVVDDLVTVFQVTDIRKIMSTYTQDKRHHDPMIHFYEDFLSQYNPSLRKSKGVWYTPQPVVGFIVRAVDEILKTEFGLPDGLADYSMIQKEVSEEQRYDRRTKDGMKHTMKSFHKVQILDPATGTGTFLAEVVNLIYDHYRGNQGIWQQYVEQHLLPRLNGFEILMASYAVAHLKLDMLLGETGYQHQTDKRLRIYLTNSLEECSTEQPTLFSQWLSREGTEANVIKRDCPVMVMIGNPPYSISSQNNGEWITNLIADYKKDLNERNIQPLSDDYIKFYRLGQYYVEKNGSGILAYISNNGFLDGVIHRQMRHTLMQVFDEIYILDLHGNSRKQEVAPDGSKDENVFDIMQGVSINIFVKTGKKAKGELASVYHQNIYGTREDKYACLNEATLSSVQWEKLNPTEPYYFYAPKDFSVQDEYEKGFKIDELLMTNCIGVATGSDSSLTKFDKEELLSSINNANADLIQKYSYRPFDNRYIYYDTRLVQRAREQIMRHMKKDNISLLCTSKNRQISTLYVSLSRNISDRHYLDSSSDSMSVFPLYLYKENMGTEERIPNLNPDVLKQIEQSLGEQVEPQDLFDYIYAVLHSPSYRERYKEFLKIDFPRIPYPTDTERYHALAALGTKLRKLHLMEGLPNQTGVTFPAAGTLQVDCYRWEQNRVYINSEQYFEGVPESAWTFYIGGYQPAQKWLKDRKGMTLSFEDVMHYQRIIYVLQQTEQIMQEIDKIKNLTK